MWIYKVTNIQNNKIYIGQSSRNVKERISRHFNDAESGRLDTHFCRAIRKYGRESFIWEIIDEAETQEGLNQKEHYWIDYYNTVNEGYNEIDSILKCGGNTYLNKTPEEMDAIKEKIRQSKLGDKNPNHIKVKQINVETGEEMIFGSQMEGARYHHVKNKDFIAKRCSGQITTPYHGIYMFEYYNE